LIFSFQLIITINELINEYKILFEKKKSPVKPDFYMSPFVGIAAGWKPAGF